MAVRAFLRYRKGMDYTEIQSFYGYDMQRAHEAAVKYRAAIEEEMNRVGLEAIKRPLAITSGQEACHIPYSSSSMYFQQYPSADVQ